jgi:hypothetical protein
VAQQRTAWLDFGPQNNDHSKLAALWPYSLTVSAQTNSLRFVAYGHSDLLCRWYASSCCSRYSSRCWWTYLHMWRPHSSFLVGARSAQVTNWFHPTEFLSARQMRTTSFRLHFGLYPLNTNQDRLSSCRLFHATRSLAPTPVLNFYWWSGLWHQMLPLHLHSAPVDTYYFPAQWRQLISFLFRSPCVPTGN